MAETTESKLDRVKALIEQRAKVVAEHYATAQDNDIEQRRNELLNGDTAWQTENRSARR